MARFFCRCRHCDARRTLRRHPDEYQRVPKCRMCRRDRWRVDRWRAKHERGRSCSCWGYSFPHRRGSLYCHHNPNVTEQQLQARIEQGAWA